jgi:hypothetical protein
MDHEMFEGIYCVISFNFYAFRSDAKIILSAANDGIIIAWNSAGNTVYDRMHVSLLANKITFYLFLRFCNLQVKASIVRELCYVRIWF